jgi:hypothetical protein
MTVYAGEVVKVEELKKIARGFDLDWAEFKGSQPYDKNCLLLATEEWYIIHSEPSNHKMRDWLKKNGEELRHIGWLDFFRKNQKGKFKAVKMPNIYQGMLI